MTSRPRILITGASSGLGEAMARRWATPGRTLVLAARRRDRLDALATELSERDEVTVDVRTLGVTDREHATAIAPAFPWAPIARVLPLLPDRLVGRRG